MEINGIKNGHEHDFEDGGVKIGRGAFGHVYKVRCRSCCKYFARKDIAIKSILDPYWREKYIHYMDSELDFLRRLKHPHVVSYVNHTRPDPKELQIFTEYCSYGDIHNKIGNFDKPLSEEFVWHVCEAIASALATCHHGFKSQGERGKEEYCELPASWTPVIHRDIKPSNIFVTQDPTKPLDKYEMHTDSDCILWDDGYIVKLGDFGTACELHEEHMPSTIAGTEFFWAPELEKKIAERKLALGNRQFADKETETTLNVKIPMPWSTGCDIWSVGATLYFLVTRRYPWKSMGLVRLTERTIALKAELNANNHVISDALVKMICECLDPDVRGRPSALDILCISMKAQTSIEARRKSQSFWTALAISYEGPGRSLVANTTRHFITEYLSILQAKFSQTEACLIMCLQALFQERSTLTTATRLAKSFDDENSAATILHAAASVTPTNELISKLTWDVTKWPFHPSLSQLSLRADGEGLLPAMVAALSGGRNASILLLDIENKTRQEKIQRLIDEEVNKFRLTSAAHAREEAKFLSNLLTNNNTTPWNLQGSIAALGISAAAIQGYETVIRVLYDLKVGITGKIGKRKETALHFAAGAGNTSIMNFLLDNGAIIERRDDQQSVPLHYAAWNGHTEAVLILLTRGASIDAEDGQGRTALYWAAFKGHGPVVKLLISRGANTSTQGGKFHVTPQEIAEKEGHVEIAQVLQAAGNRMRLDQKNIKLS